MGRERGKWAVVRVLGAAALALAAAYVASSLLWPSGPIVDPVAMAPADWFTAEQLDRMLDFRRPQRLIGLGLIAAELLALAAIAYWAPPRIQRAWPSHPVAVAMATGAAIALVLAAIALPFGLLAGERSRDAGLLVQPLGVWLLDRLTAEAIAVVLAAIGAAVAMVMIRRLRGFWWMAGSAAVALYAVLVIWLWPVLISPIFADFEPLPEGPAREEILALADRAEVDVGEVLVSDTGERSTAIRAYVTGLGPTKRIVVSDNALRELDAPALRTILAHELAHVRHDDVQRALVWLILVAPFGVLFVQVASTALARARGVDPYSPAVIPALALSLSVAVLVLSVPANHLSRGVEARADTFAMQLTGEPAAMIELQRETAIANLSDPDPPGALHYAFASHPSKVDRIGAALSFAEEIGVGAPDPETFLEPEAGTSDSDRCYSGRQEGATDPGRGTREGS